MSDESRPFRSAVVQLYDSRATSGYPNQLWVDKRDDSKGSRTAKAMLPSFEFSFTHHRLENVKLEIFGAVRIKKSLNSTIASPCVCATIIIAALLYFQERTILLLDWIQK